VRTILLPHNAHCTRLSVWPIISSEHWLYSLSGLLDACSDFTFQSRVGLFFKNRSQTGNRGFPRNLLKPM